MVFHQPIWKICSSNWIISPSVGVKIIQVFELPPPRKQSDPFKNPLQIVTCGSKTPPWASWGSFPSASSSSMAATTRKRRQKMVQPLRQGWDEVMACNKNVTKMWLMRYVQFLQTSEHIIHKPWYRNRKRGHKFSSRWVSLSRKPKKQLGPCVLTTRNFTEKPSELSAESKSRHFFFLVRRCTDNPTWVWTSCSTLRWKVAENTNWQRAAIPFGRQGNMGILRLKSTHVL